MLVDARGGSINDLLVAKNDMRDAELQASTAPHRSSATSIV
jgi:hypothetical protein